jgi:hypothetical protein
MGRSEPIPQAPLPAQRSAALRSAFAALRSALGASANAPAWAIGSERLSAPLLHACACRRRTRSRTSRRGPARAQRCCDRAAPGRCGDVARRRTGRTRTARAIPPLQRYGRGGATATTGSKQWCNVGTPSTQWELRAPCQGTPVRVPHMRPRVLIVPRTSWPTPARLCISPKTSAPAQMSSAWPMSAEKTAQDRPAA